jgi:hypothetical protein
MDIIQLQDRVLPLVSKLLGSSGSAEPHLPPTFLYNEGWLLRLVLSAASSGIPCLPFRFENRAGWFSEALLDSAFLPRYRGDHLAETWTHADGVVGHFSFRPNRKGGLSLDNSGSQFVVLEAKVFSPLSRGTTRAPEFDQAARNVACMAETLRRCGRPMGQWTCLGFYILAPKVQIDAGLFNTEVSKESIRKKIASRIKAYEPCEHLNDWNQEWVSLLLDRIHIECLDWESIIDIIQGHDRDLGEGLGYFYDLTLDYNRRPSASEPARGGLASPQNFQSL